MARRPAPLNRFSITSPELPGVVFKSIPDLYDNASIAVIAHTAIAEYIVDRCEIPLWETLRDRCGWDADAIKATIRNPRKPPSICYGWPAHYGSGSWDDGMDSALVESPSIVPPDDASAFSIGSPSFL